MALIRLLAREPPYAVGVALKRWEKINKLLQLGWPFLEGIMPSEINQVEKRQVLYDLTYRWNLKKLNSDI